MQGRGRSANKPHCESEAGLRRGGRTRGDRPAPARAQGLTPEQAAERFYILDADGLVTRKRGDALTDTVRPYARAEEDLEGARLEEVVKHVRRAPPGAGPAR
jgi:hypothetical protein